MSGFLKKFGQGILYVLVLPVFIVVLALYAVYGVFIFIFMFFKSIILFFKGKSVSSDLPEDIEAKRRMKLLTNPFDNPAPQPEPKDVRDPVVIIERPKDESLVDIETEHQRLEDRGPVNKIEYGENKFPEIRDQSIDKIAFKDKEEEPEEETQHSIFEDEEETQVNVMEDEILPPDDTGDKYEDDDSFTDTGGVSISDWRDD